MSNLGISIPPPCFIATVISVGTNRTTRIAVIEPTVVYSDQSADELASGNRYIRAEILDRPLIAPYQAPHIIMAVNRARDTTIGESAQIVSHQCSGKISCPDCSVFGCPYLIRGLFSTVAQERRRFGIGNRDPVRPFPLQNEDNPGHLR